MLFSKAESRYWNIQEFQQKRNVLKNPDERLRDVLVRIYNHENIADYTLPARLMFVSLNLDLVIHHLKGNWVFVYWS